MNTLISNNTHRHIFKSAYLALTVFLVYFSTNIASANTSPDFQVDETPLSSQTFHETTQIAELIWADLTSRFVELYQQNDYPAALSAVQRAYEISENNFGINDVNTADSLLKLGIINQTLGNLSLAEHYILGSLVILEDQLSHDHPDLAVVLTNLGNIYYELGRLKASEDSHQKALSIRENAFGQSDPGVPQSLYNLAVLYEHKREYAKAAQFYQRAIRLWIKTLGPNHPYIGNALANLTNTYAMQSKYIEAAKTQYQTVIYNKSVFGTRHQEVAQSLVDLGTLYLEQGEFNPATNAYEEALAIAEHILNSSDPQLALLMYTLANVYHTQALVVQAPTEALSTDKNTQTTGNKENATANGTNSYFSQALPLYEKAVEILDTESNTNTSVLEVVLAELAILYKEMGDLDKATATESRMHTAP